LEEQKNTEKQIVRNFKDAQEAHKNAKKALEDMKAARGKPESSISVDIEVTLAKFLISRASYHGGDFNGVCCRRLVQNADEVISEIKPVILSKREKICEELTVCKKLDILQNALGLLDAVFAHLNKINPTPEEKLLTREAIQTLMKFWRNTLQMSVSLKGHIMEKHVCDFNDNCGVGDKEESFVEQGHQVGLKDDRRYYGLTNFVKRTEATLKARSIASHPMVLENQKNVLDNSRRKRSQPDGKDKIINEKAKIKRQNVKDEKESKREHYVRTNK